MKTVREPVRMADVARAAGVARVTVSRVLSDPDSVAPATRQAVQDAIARLGYLPNLNAGALASRRSRIVGAIVPTLSNAWFGETIDGLSQALAGSGYQLLLGQTRYRPDEEAALVDAFLGRGVDAMVLTGVHHAPGVRERLQRAALPTVECWELAPNPIDMAVGFSNAAAGEAVGRHLLERGRRCIGFIGSEEARAAQRLEGLRRALAAAGHAAPVVALVQPPSSIADGAQGLQALVARQPALDAVFCSNDTLALGALAHCRSAGRAVPEAMAVVGFSDLPVAAVSVPPLSTVEIHSHGIGLRAGELLLQRLSEPDAAPGAQALDRIQDLGFQVRVRESS